MPASEQDMGDSHAEMIALLRGRIKDKTITAAELSVLRQLLRDSNIQCDPKSQNIRDITKEMPPDDEEADEGPIRFPISK